MHCVQRRRTAAILWLTKEWFCPGGIHRSFLRWICFENPHPRQTRPRRSVKFQGRDAPPPRMQALPTYRWNSVSPVYPETLQRLKNRRFDQICVESPGWSIPGWNRLKKYSPSPSVPDEILCPPPTGSQPFPDDNASFCGRCDSGNNFKQGGFSGAVFTNDSHFSPGRMLNEISSMAQKSF